MISITDSALDLSRPTSGNTPSPPLTTPGSSDDRQLIDDYWFLLHVIIVPVLFGMISLVGLIGNILVIYVIWSNARMRTVINMLLLNLAIADLCFVIIVPPFTAHQYIGNGYGSEDLYQPPAFKFGNQRTVKRDLRSNPEHGGSAIPNISQTDQPILYSQNQSDKLSRKDSKPNELKSVIFTSYRDTDSIYDKTSQEKTLIRKPDDSHLPVRKHIKPHRVRNIHSHRGSGGSAGGVNRVARDNRNFNSNGAFSEASLPQRRGNAWKTSNGLMSGSSSSDTPPGSGAAVAFCKSLHYVVNVTAYCTVYTLVMIAALRYMTVVHNVRTIRIRTKNNVVIIISLLWILVILFNIPVLTVYDYRLSPDQPSETKRYQCDVTNEVGQRLFISFFLLAYLFPLLAIALLSAAILRHLAKHRAGFERASVRLDDESSGGERVSRSLCSRVWNRLRHCCSSENHQQVNQHELGDVANGEKRTDVEGNGEERVRLHKCDSGRSDYHNDRDSEVESVHRHSCWNCCSPRTHTNHHEDLPANHLRSPKQEDRNRTRNFQVGRTAEMKKQASRLIVLVVVMFAVSWLPVNIHLLVTFYVDKQTRNSLDNSSVYRTFVIVWNCLAYMNSCVNPFIYSHVSKDFRDAFRDAVGCRRRSGGAAEADQVQMLPMDHGRGDLRNNGVVEDLRVDTAHVHLTPLSPNRVQRDSHEQPDVHTIERDEGQVDANRNSTSAVDQTNDGRVHSDKISKEASSERGSTATGFCNSVLVAEGDEVDNDNDSKGLVDVRVDIDVSISG